MRKQGYTLQDQVRDVTRTYAAEVGDKLSEIGMHSRYHVQFTNNGMRFVFEASLGGYPDEPLPKDAEFTTVNLSTRLESPPPLPPSLQEKDGPDDER